MLSGFDYETSAGSRITAEVADDGKVLVSGRLLADIARACPPSRSTWRSTAPRSR